MLLDLVINFIWTFYFLQMKNLFQKNRIQDGHCFGKNVCQIIIIIVFNGLLLLVIQSFTGAYLEERERFPYCPLYDKKERPKDLCQGCKIFSWWWQQLFRRREQKRKEPKEAHLFERYREKGVAGERKVSAMNCQDWFTCVAYDFIVVVCLVLEFHLNWQWRVSRRWRNWWR